MYISGTVMKMEMKITPEIQSTFKKKFSNSNLELVIKTASIILLVETGESWT